LAALIAHFGLLYLEQKLSLNLFLKRVAAALLMSGAIAFFYLGARF
jgi:hypothetical protein